MESLGLLVALATLIILALRGVNVIFASMLCSLIVMLTNGISPIEGFSSLYVSGPLGAFSFASKFFLLFVAGAIFGRVLAESGSTISFARFLAQKLGAERTLLIVTLVTALLTYGGVTVFIVIFTIYPLSLRLLEEGNIPKRLFAAAFALGGGTFTLTALPGTPSIHNVISASKLGTDLFAGAWLGLLAAAVMLFVGLWYLERERQKAIRNGEPFKLADGDSRYHASLRDDQLPGVFAAIFPLVVVLGLIMLPRFILMALGEAYLSSGTALAEVLLLAKTQPILWPCLALIVGSVTTVLMSPVLRGKALTALGVGAQDAVNPLINTAAVIGFGSVVAQTSGFEIFSRSMLETGIEPLLSIAISANITSGIVGSASGGLGIFMETLAPAYLELGVDKEVLHRLAAIASGGLDALPHSGAVVAFLAVCSLTHKEAYKDIAVTCIAIPLLALFAATLLAYVIY